MYARFFVLVAASALTLFANVRCASVNSVALTPIPSNRSNQVEAEVSKTIFLAFNFDNDYIDPLIEQLKNKCPNGIVSGILTKDETIHYFLVFKKRVTATGFCNSSKTAARASGKKRNPSSEGEVEPGEENL